MCFKIYHSRGLDELTTENISVSVTTLGHWQPGTVAKSQQKDSKGLNFIVFFSHGSVGSNSKGLASRLHLKRPGPAAKRLTVPGLRFSEELGRCFVRPWSDPSVAAKDQVRHDELLVVWGAKASSYLLGQAWDCQS